MLGRREEKTGTRDARRKENLKRGRTKAPRLQKVVEPGRWPDWRAGATCRLPTTTKLLTTTPIVNKNKNRTGTSNQCETHWFFLHSTERKLIRLLIELGNIHKKILRSTSLRARKHQNRKNRPSHFWSRTASHIQNVLVLLPA